MPARSVRLAVALFFVAPLVAEFLLGNLSIQLLPALLILAPMYGGGALLIREVVRRTGRGWPSIGLLALVFGIVEEAYATQSLFNPDYLKMNLHLLDPAYISALGIGAWWTVFVLALHTGWSISTSIALVEALQSERLRSRPWLGRVGLAVTALLFAFGVVASASFSYKHDRFLASPAQFASAGVLCVVLISAAFFLPRMRSTALPAQAPTAWLVAAFTLIAGSIVLVTPSRWGWWAVIIILAASGAVTAPLLFWSRFENWTERHNLAAAAGAAMAYAWHSFLQRPVAGASITATRIGNVVFTAAAIALTAAGARKTHAVRQ